MGSRFPQRKINNSWALPFCNRIQVGSDFLKSIIVGLFLFAIEYKMVVISFCNRIQVGSDFLRDCVLEK
jgi:hypothetical protein